MATPVGEGLWIVKISEERNRGNAVYKRWRKSVFERDNYTCQICGTRGGKLDAHHIVAWSDSIRLRYEVNNGQTLCSKCHYKLHREQNIGGTNE